MDIVNEERLIHTRYCLQVPGKESWRGLIERLSALRRYEFAARFGDYTKDVCKQLKKTDVEYRTQDYHVIAGWDNEWTNIAAQLAIEKPVWQRYTAHDRLVSEQDIVTHLAILAACRSMGANFDATLTAITLYADRNSIVHMSTNNLIEQGRWDDLKHNLIRDLLDVVKVTPPHLKHTIPVMQSIIYTIIDRY